MPYVKFQHKTYGAMKTIPENWIRYELFDAIDKIGDSWPVYKKDCNNARYFEE